MSSLTSTERRHFLRTVVAGAAALTVMDLGIIDSARAAAPSPAQPPLPSAGDPMGPIRQVRAGVLDIGYFETGPGNGQPVLLLHGFPFDIHSYAGVAPMLAEQGYRVIVPYLRGHGPTRFLDATTPRSGQQGANGADIIALMDALKIQAAVLAGYDWGARAACVAAALWPERCKALVSANGYLIQDIAHATKPIPAKIESSLWFQYYFQIERGREGLSADRRSIARLIWTRNSPSWHFDEATFERTAAAFDNPDFVDVVIHSYRHRLGLAPSYPPYEEIERKLAPLPVITVPTITLDGDADGVAPPTDGTAYRKKFPGKFVHRIIKGAGHNLPQEAPRAFADAVNAISLKQPEHE